MDELTKAISHIKWNKLETLARFGLQTCFINDSTLWDSYNISKGVWDDLEIQCTYKCVHFKSTGLPEIALSVTLSGFLKEELAFSRDAKFTYQYIVDENFEFVDEFLF